jgi:hypothetical protein
MHPEAVETGIIADILMRPDSGELFKHMGHNYPRYSTNKSYYK